MNYAAPTRTFRRQLRPWNPLPYMRRAVDFLKGRYRAGLPLKPGGRKTSITLAAFSELKAEGKVRTMLVVAPKRVARQVWRQEGEKWDDFRHLSFATVIGDAGKRKKALQSGADIYLINYENLPWLCKLYMGRPLPFDIIVFDELTKMQNAQSERSKAIRPRLPGLGYRWGLTGSLFAKGHQSIFGQQLVLDDGAALGKFFTHFRDLYFTVGFNGFDYDLLPGAEQRMTEKLAPYWFYMDESDYSQLPPLIDVPHVAEMEPQQRQLYDRLERDALIQIGVDTVTAANAGAVYAKLAQMANGALYRDQHTNREDFIPIHDLKLEMLEELLEELAGEPLLVAYEFQHDLERIQRHFGPRFGGLVPYLGAGTTNRQEDQWVAEWNERKLPLLLAHPQSAGHGLNMQEGQAYNVAWFSVCWDWELYDQFIRRVRRSGNEQARIFNHLLLIRGTIDEDKLRSVAEKDFTERRMMTALNNRILRESQDHMEVDIMVAKLNRPGEAPPQQQTAAPPPSGGAPAGWGGGGNANADQRGRIQEQIDPQQNRATAAASAFTGGGAVGEAAGALQQDYNDAPQGAAPAGWGGGGGAAQETQAPKATRSRKPAAPETPTADLIDVALIEARARIVAAIAMSEPDATVDDIVGAARDLMKFVTEG